MKMTDAMPRLLALSGKALLLACLLAAAAPDAGAEWGKCVYSDGTSDNGPCVEVRNDLGWQYIGDGEMNVWCSYGPTGVNHKIVLQPLNQSFTCKGRSDKDNWVKIQRKQVSCDPCWPKSPCGNEKYEMSLRENGWTNTCQGLGK